MKFLILIFFLLVAAIFGFIAFRTYSMGLYGDSAIMAVMALISVALGFAGWKAMKVVDAEKITEAGDG